MSPAFKQAFTANTAVIKRKATIVFISKIFEVINDNKLMENGNN
jgi:hypothetical protein